MIVRIRIVNENSVVHKWSIFVIPEATSLKDTYLGIRSGHFSCGRLIDLTMFESEFKCSVATKRTVPEASDMMPVHESARIGDLKEKDALYIEFEVQKIKVIGVDNSQMDMNSEPESVVIVDSVTTALMNRHDRYVQLKQSEKYGNHQQFNALVALSKEHRWGVHTSAVSDYTDMFQSFSDLLWEVDLHYSKFVAHGGRVSKRKNFQEVQETKQTRYFKTGHASFAEPHNEPNQVFGA